MNIHWLWWVIATYLLIGATITIQDFFNARTTGAMKKFNIRWLDIVLSIPIATLVYLLMKPWRKRDG